MAITITRTAWTDDDGTGTVGSVINNAEKTGLYNQIDAALALLLPLAGGTLDGLLVSTSGGIRQAGSAMTRIENTGGVVPSGAAGAGVEIYNSGIQAFNRTTAVASPLTLSGSVITLSGVGSFADSDKYLLIDASGNIHKSALGPAS